MDKASDVLLRVNPGIEAHTHEYIQTAKNDSKFGESIYGESIGRILRSVDHSKHVRLRGFHCHIGSQIFEEESFHSAAAEMMGFLADVKAKYGVVTEELNLGGGFGVYYADGDSPFDIKTCLKRMLDVIKVQAVWLKINQPKVMIEPGRAIIGNAGTTIYEIGGIKKTYGGKNYIFVDGGMSDNPRTALYDAVYEAIVANKANDESREQYTVAGKCCESGDVLIKNIELPVAEKGDTLAILTTGAYNYSMASNYNRIPRAAVVFVKDGKARLAVKRESYDDLILNDVLL
jgi:diaminopimelate decarboxylase